MVWLTDTRRWSGESKGRKIKGGKRRIKGGKGGGERNGKREMTLVPSYFKTRDTEQLERHQRALKDHSGVDGYIG